MDGSQFDAWARTLFETQSRRRVTRQLGGLVLGAPLAFRHPGEVLAKRKKANKKKKKQGNRPIVPPGCPSGEKTCEGGCIPSSQCCNTADCPGAGRICSPARQCCTKNDFPNGGSATNCCSLSSSSGFCRGQAAGTICTFAEVCQTRNCVQGTCSSCPEVFDSCAQSAETCPTGQCMKVVDGTTRCGIRNLLIACNGCTSNASCPAGQFCAINSGPNCQCATGETFCAKTF